MLTECARAVAWWLGSSEGLYAFLLVVFLFGVLAGWGTVGQLPDRLRRFLVR